MNPLIVHLHGKLVGALDDDGQRLVFRYDEAWLADAGALPLSRQLPLQAEPFEGQRVNVFFGGLLPEADSRDQIARNLGISANNDFAMLERIGGECAGAISLVPGEKEGRAPADGGVRWLNPKTEVGSFFGYAAHVSSADFPSIIPSPGGSDGNFGEVAPGHCKMLSSKGLCLLRPPQLSAM